MKRFAQLMLLLILLAACGRTESRQPVLTGQNLTATPTIMNIAATHDHQTMVVEGATADALDLAYNQRMSNLTATALADPRPTVDENNPPTSEPYVPQPTHELRLFTHQECDPSTDTEWRGPTFTTNCWHGIVNGHDLFVSAGGTQSQPGQLGFGFIKVTEGIETSQYRYPTAQGEVTIVSVQQPSLLVSVNGTFNVLFNLETHQWLNLNGTPVVTDPTETPLVPQPTSTATPSNGQAVTSLTLFNADTDQPVTGFDPLANGVTLNFATLGTHNLNIRANTSPATVGSVTFTLDGTVIRIEGGAPYALAGNNGADYYAWTPSVGSHTLIVTPYSGGNATGTLGTALTVTFTVVEGTSVTATATSVPSATATRTLTPVATATRTNTPVPATATSVPATVTPGGTAKTALFVVNNATLLNAGDTAVKTRLIGLGYSVTPKTASTAVTSDATGKTLVLISSSVASGDVAAKFKSVTVPVIVWEQALYDDMALTGTIATTDYGTASSSSLVISNAAHPLAGGLSGTVTVFNAVAAMPYGVPSANAVSLAPQGTSPTKKVYFAYDKNTAMVGGFTVNARRVGLFWVDTATAMPDAWIMFDAAVTWASAP